MAAMTPSLAASYLNPDLSVGAGGHHNKPGGCAMEWISLLGTHVRWVNGRFELLPGVTWKQANEAKTARVDDITFPVSVTVWTVNDVLSELERQDLALGLVTLCAAGGMGIAMVLERTV